MCGLTGQPAIDQKPHPTDLRAIPQYIANLAFNQRGSLVKFKP
jgi:hypothetical protein